MDEFFHHSDIVPYKIVFFFLVFYSKGAETFETFTKNIKMFKMSLCTIHKKPETREPF